MKDTLKSLNSGRSSFFLLIFICCIVAVAVLKLTSTVILPFTVAALLTFVFYPLTAWLSKFHIPRVFSILLAVVILVFGMYVLGMVMFSFGRRFLSLIPRYDDRLTEIYIWIASFFELS